MSMNYIFVFPLELGISAIERKCVFTYKTNQQFSE